MTAGERLRHLAGQAGSAAALLLLIGSGATAGAALVEYSGLETATAAQHLLAEKAVVAQPVYGAGRQAKIDIGPSVERVLDSWDWLEQQRAQQRQGEPAGIIHPEIAPAAQAIPAPVAAETTPIRSAQIHPSVSADSVALASLHRRNRRAMLMLLAMAEDDD